MCITIWDITTWTEISKLKKKYRLRFGWFLSWSSIVYKRTAMCQGWLGSEGG